MSEGTKIAWCDDTMNFWQGCTKVSPGCQHCYAEARDQRFSGGAHWGKNAPRVRSKDFDAPLRWTENSFICEACGAASKNPIGDKESMLGYCEACKTGCVPFHRRRVFSLSLGDWLDDEVPIEWLVDMLDVIRRCPNLDFLLLTKRPENFQKRLLHAGMEMMGYVDGQKSTTPEAFATVPDEAIEWVLGWSKLETCPSNVWLGVTVENQEYADKRIPELLNIPAVCRFISYEPALGPVDFDGYLREECCHCGDDKKGYHDNHSYTPMYGERLIDWIIVGGESGPKARPFNIEWARSTVAQCKAAGVACFVKQMGTFPIDRNDAGFEGETEKQWPEGAEISDINKADTEVYQGKLMRIHLRDKKGGDMAEWPHDLRVREFPAVKSSPVQTC